MFMIFLHRKLYVNRFILSIIVSILFIGLMACTSTVRYGKKSSVTAKNSYRIDSAVSKTRVDGSPLREFISSWLGVPYRYGGTGKSGIDCSAFTGIIYQDVYGINLPRTTDSMMAGGKPVAGKDYKEGDLLFFRIGRAGKVDHVGVYLGGGEFVHASASSGVTISDLGEKYYRRRFIKARRYLD
jgi:probable lipoprotein NlpC